MFLKEKQLESALYLVTTPIGNLEDFSFRAQRILKEMNLIAAEDTRHSQKLLNHFTIQIPMISYREHNHDKAWPKIEQVLKNKGSVALITDAGAPTISDPGAYLVEKTRQAGFKIIPIPGPSAVIMALSASGFIANQFTFAGFPPAKTKARQDFYTDLIYLKHTLVFFETPHRLAASLDDMEKIFGNRKLVLARELTKIHEEIILSTISELKADLELNPRKGEITLVLEGASKTKENLISPEEIKELALNDKRSTKNLAHDLSEISNLSRRDIYKLIVESRKKDLK